MYTIFSSNPPKWQLTFGVFEAFLYETILGRIQGSTVVNYVKAASSGSAHIEILPAITTAVVSAVIYVGSIRNRCETPKWKRSYHHYENTSN
ncbi:hypothetical protein Y032_0016g2934 [Ancylostoma ceylanicum]|uniref:Uncharacterized protein n=1 Tax=Ancylostoma ceylanicum TaxID=53326 RepID=A0A016V7R0_9BILA|nr:hypothetical protein Y032_0016g2934 [Ancylostoma ceylanicum]